jgi:trans-aconitate 2-methyltransferase
VSGAAGIDADGWDAGLYDAISDMQLGWGIKVLDRIELTGDENVLDAGCGTGKVTALIAQRVPRGRMIGIDASRSMIDEARKRLPPEVELIVGDLLDIELADPVDVVFSNATFHWIHDHDRLFQRLHSTLRPGGRLEVQFGGEGNVAALEAAVREASATPPFAEYLDGASLPWRFRSPEETTAALDRAGFVEVRCWTERITESFDEGRDLRACGVGDYIRQLPASLRERFVAAVVDAMDDPTVREYVRLNVSAWRSR